eukprot:TRINITY_DN2708_c0_g1_i6.p1 TRINITY_DN2708_c0_g1~~TRINITY_DN2708_c0_g1_i6.p1  ORF type:complete len:294 (-),score=28.81 TRINITY_DN2708_c0_g1_i6:27-887(-)
MELERDIGQHCSYNDCNMLDFLPFTCDRCKEVFCGEHRRYEDHKCAISYDKVVPSCPLCNQIIHCKPGEDVNAKVNAHINQGCPKEVTATTKKYPCSLNLCKSKELQPIYCANCKKQYCMRHKLPSAHSCSANNRPSSSPSTTKSNQKPPEPSIWENISKHITDSMARYTQRDPEAAKKMAAAKMKQQAQGSESVPVADRFYLEIIYPMESNLKSAFFFFENTTRLGVVLDKVAAGKVENKNNQANARKLQLISLKTGTPLALNLQLKAIPGFSSGDALLLEYESK